MQSNRRAPDISPKIVIAVAIAVALLLVVSAFFSERDGDIDEIGLYNPTYMAVHYGKMTYPAHGYFTNMVVHPPVHYEAIAILMRLGLSLYYAQATPALLMLFLCIALIVRGPFTGAVKIGFLYGLWMSVAVFGRTGVEMFGMRPENHLGAAWLSGLLALESARLENWNLRLLFLGSFLLTYSSGVHYYAALGTLGVVVYAVWAVKSLGLRAAKRPLMAIALGGLLFGVPYLLLFYVPNQAGILKIVHDTQAGGIADSIQVHRAQYQTFLQQPVGGFWLMLPLITGIPMVLFATPILLAIRGTRGIALAALPLQIFLLAFAGHKHAYYYIHEVAIYGTAVAAGSLTLTGRIQRKAPRYGAWACLAAVLALGWWQLHKWEGTGRGPFFSLTPRVHEAEIARAAARRMLPPNPRVASRIGAWYVSGGDMWHDPAPDLLWPKTVANLNPANYFSRFDAVAEIRHMSDFTLNQEHKSLLSWYLDGTLQLRGFFFSYTNKALTYVLLQTPGEGRLTGFALKDGMVYRFVANEHGAAELDMITSGENDAYFAFRDKATFSDVMGIPKASEADPQQYLVMAVRPATKVPAGKSPIPGGRLVQRTLGDLAPFDKDLLILQLRQEDRPMRFYLGLGDMPAR